MALTTNSPRLSIDPQLVWDLGYELLDLANSTSCCDIWEVRHRTTYEIYAWKQLRPEFETDAVAQQGLQNEAAVARLVQSPLLPIVTCAHVNERPYYLLYEWFSGDTLEQAIQEFAPLPIRLTLWITRQSAEALDALLQVGLVHGAVQPDNILIRENGTICLTEFVQTRRVASQLTVETPRRLTPATGPLDDYVAITTLHQPPRGLAKDLHGLGILLFRSLTGHFPFEQHTAAEIVSGQHGDPALELRRARPEVSEKLAHLVGDLLSPIPERRPKNPASVAHRLMELEIESLLS
ncbi:MAG: Serine/threonine protein kinase [Planctomycetaceae bacterium]|nr:Serine/threonine protein kinase [Planctomycetaceae bacterium]